MGRGMLSKSLTQFSVDWQGCVPSLFFNLRPNYGGGSEDNSSLLQKVHAHSATLSAPDPSAGHHRPMPPPETPEHSNSKSRSVSCGITAPFSWVLVGTRFCLCPPRLFPSCVSSGSSMAGLTATSSKTAYAIPRSAAPRAPAAGHC